jgi:FtsZ-binding cell division protein ZapB
MSLSTSTKVLFGASTYSCQNENQVLRIRQIRPVRIPQGIESIIASQDAEIKDLKRKISALETSQSISNEQIAALSAETSFTKAENNDLRTKIEALELVIFGQKSS